MMPMFFSLSRGLLRARCFELGVLIFATLFCWAPARATSAVALLDSKNHRVVIAADCRVAHQDGSASECKIIDEPGCTAAMAGLYWEETTTFHLRKLVIAACRFPGNLRDKAEAFLRASKTSYERAARHIRDVDPIEFHETTENKPTEVIFAGIEKGRLTLFVRGLVADSRGNVTVERYETSDRVDSSLGFFAGLNLHIREYVGSHREWVNEDFLTAARKFVEMEIMANPELAGPPVSEIEIDGQGTVRWISRGACDTREPD
jgi:hypothetical protein